MVSIENASVTNGWMGWTYGSPNLCGGESGLSQNEHNSHIVWYG